MFMRFVHLSIKKEYENTFRQIYNIVVLPKLGKMEGCKMAGLIKSNEDDGDFISISLWDKKNQAEKYEKSDAYKYLSNQIKQFLSESSEWKLQLSDDYKIEYKPTKDSPLKQNYAIAVSTQNAASSPVPPGGMYIKIVSLNIQPDKVKEFRNIFAREIIPELELAEGCSFAYLIKSMKQPNEFLNISVWESKEFAERHESSEKFGKLMSKINHTLSKFYLWKMELEKKSKGKVETSEDIKIDDYTMITGKSFN